MQQKGSLYLYRLLPARTCSNGHHTTYLLTFREVSKLFIKCMGEGKLPNVIFIWESLNSSNEQRKCKQRGSAAYTSCGRGKDVLCFRRVRFNGLYQANNTIQKFTKTIKIGLNYSTQYKRLKGLKEEM